MEWLQAVELFAGAHELDRHARDRAHGDGCAAARVTVYFGQDQPGQADALVEALGDAHCFLAGHRVGDEQNLGGLRALADGDQLVHHLVVNLQAPGSVEQDDRRIGVAGRLHAARTDIWRRGGCPFLVVRDVRLPGQRHELVYGGGAIGVASYQERAATVAAQHESQLSGGCRLAGALQTDKHDHARRRAAQIQATRLTERGDQFLVDDLDHLLRRLEALLDFSADGPLFDAVDEVLGDLEVDVGFQQGHAHLAHGDIDVILGQLALAPKLFKDVLQAITEAFEHAGCFAFRSECRGGIVKDRRAPVKRESGLGACKTCQAVW